MIATALKKIANTWSNFLAVTYLEISEQCAGFDERVL